MPRNALRQSRLYEYNSDAEKRDIKSPFPSIASFTSQLLRKEVDLRESFKWKTMNLKDTVNEG